ncbi:nad-dependent 15-hydroxyprostaglandin dehydrogenase [Colletotrichum musicola]|uniref:Nad-dependent 15-hydroxyprostaglandin dehydrogenase n=1 Tax=Colletotrichum musicola TaxID=2175873 RepID=A0A8H6MT90_9PEZI|nr:nad-dependent 15-hydroxyprostaglandin dehydrogenase [Colletotrichum musicola]
MSAYEVKGKFAVVTGGGSGINRVFVQMLLEAGCSVVIADLKLTADAENTLQKYSKENAATNGAYAIFHPTDLVNWSQINSLWETALATFPQVDIVCNGAGLYEPPASSFWSPPGVFPLAEDPADAKVGQYKTISVNTIAPIRLAQIAIDYWLQNRSVQGNLIWVASLGGYVHSIHTPMYFASKAAIVSMVKSLGRLRTEVGIRNAAVCPGATDTPIFHPDYCRQRIRADELHMTPQQLAGLMMRVLTEPEFGEGNIMEAMMLGNKKNATLGVREVPMHLLYPSCGAGEDHHLVEEEEKMVKDLKEHGMRR